MLSWLVIAFFPRGKHLNSMAAVTAHSDFRAQESKNLSVSTFSPCVYHAVMGLDTIFLNIDF